jgi:predicted anti-sigma-YlaC factor YlaD
VVALACRAIVELVSADLDGDLDADGHHRFVSHLAACEGCRRYVDQVQLTVRLVGRSADPHVVVSGSPQPVVDRVRTRVGRAWSGARPPAMWLHAGDELA